MTYINYEIAKYRQYGNRRNNSHVGMLFTLSFLHSKASTMNSPSTTPMITNLAHYNNNKYEFHKVYKRKCERVYTLLFTTYLYLGTGVQLSGE